MPNEDPYAHLATYIEICNTVRIDGVPEDAIRLSLFSFSLSGEAKRWLHSFKGNSLRTWDEDVEKVEREIKLAATAMVLQSSLEKALNNHVECLTKEEEEEVQACIEELDGAGEKSVGHAVFEELKSIRSTEKPKVELKTLPAHLKYVFLEENEAKPVIISSSLRKEEEDHLVQVLKNHKSAIGWLLSPHCNYFLLNYVSREFQWGFTRKRTGSSSI